MWTPDNLASERPPSRAVSIAVSAALVAVWGFVRLLAFETTVFPLTYAIPLLVCVWTRDRTALWCMAVVFAAFHTLKMFWLVPADLFSRAEIWTNYGATLSNIAVAAVAVHGIINLRRRLEGTLAQVREQADELGAQGEELAQQNEELAQQAEELSRQTEELTQQGEELSSQNEELQTQAEEIGALNEALERREALLQALIDTARRAGSERDALQHITRAALDLFGGIAAASVVYEKAHSGLILRAAAPTSPARGRVDAPCSDGFVELVLGQGRPASLSDTHLRPDLSMPEFGKDEPRAVLCAPFNLDGQTFGAFVVYSSQPHSWTVEEFRLSEWLAVHCAHALQTLRIQSDLREADRRKSEFLATLSHELRNPLAPIGFALRLLETDSGTTGEPVRVMRRQLQQLVRLVDDLLDATRLSSNKIQIRKTHIDLVPVVQHAVDALRPDIEAAAHTLSVTLPAHPVPLEADPDRVAQVVTNLLNNATRYTPRGGRLRVRVEVADERAVLSVADSGVGLHPADLERVFDMFTQVGGPGSGGLGIGLALVRGIVELHGGRILAKSDGPGTGSEFVVSLPLAAAAPLHSLPSQPSAHEAGAACRILVVDDNIDSAEMMGTLLELHGHDVRIAHDGRSALRAAQEFVPDAVLLDIGLPDLDGYEVARRLRQDPVTQRVRLIAVTGWGQDGDRARAQDAGFDAHLTKPADPDVVLAAVGDVQTNQAPN